MSKSVANEPIEGHKIQEMSGKRGAEDEGKEDEEEINNLPSVVSSPTLTNVSTVPATTNQFLYTPEFRRHFIEYAPGDTLMTLRLATKGWKAAADAFIDERVVSGVMIVHGGNDVEWQSYWKERRKIVTQVNFLPNTTKVGRRACEFASNLVVVDIPEGVKSIGVQTFECCSSFTAVSFPTTLTSIGFAAFNQCFSLDNIDLLHTNLQ